jgi:hypothetical protein
MSELLNLLAQIPHCEKKEELLRDVARMQEMKTDIASKVTSQLVNEVIGVTDKNYAGEVLLAIVVILFVFIAGIISLAGCSINRRGYSYDIGEDGDRYNGKHYYKTSELVIS